MLIQTDHLGIPRFTNKNLIDLIYTGHKDKIHVVLCDPSDDITGFNQAMEQQGLPTLQQYIALDVDQAEFDAVCQSEWFMPQEYQVFDLISFLKVQAAKDAGYPDTTDVRYMQTPQYQRMTEELKEFQRRGLVQLLRYLKYLVDFMRAHDIVWGVGRGSSVSSYVLFLIGVHKINPITYNLDWREFLR